MLSVMGIDPGAKGAVCILTEGKMDECVHLSSLVFSDFRDLLLGHEVAHVYLEKAQAMPGQGVSSMFNYGMGFGQLIGWIEASCVPYTLVPPALWTRTIHKGCVGKTSKEKSLQAYRRLFPNYSPIPTGCRVPHMGWVDATLIAEYGRRIYK